MQRQMALSSDIFLIIQGKLEERVVNLNWESGDNSDFRHCCWLVQGTVTCLFNVADDVRTSRYHVYLFAVIGRGEGFTTTSEGTVCRQLKRQTASLPCLKICAC